MMITAAARRRSLKLATLGGCISVLIAQAAGPGSLLNTRITGPASVPAGVATPVTITSAIAGASLIGGSVLLQRLDADGQVGAVVGRMSDDGLNGDSVAGDGVWTIQTTFTEAVPGPVYFRVSAAYRGEMFRTASRPFAIEVTGAASAALLRQAASKPTRIGILANEPAALLDYESFADGTVLTTQYIGDTFSNAIVRTAGISLNEFEFPPHSGTNVVSDNGGALTLVSAYPVQSFSASFTYNVPLVVTAFNAAGQTVGTANSHFDNNMALSGSAGTSVNDVIQIIYAPGITRVVVTGAAGGSSFAMDDTRLGAGLGGTPTPPPTPTPTPTPGPPATPPLGIATLSNLGTVVLGSGLSATLAASGGVAPYSWAGTGSGGVTVSPDGRISGTPAAAGNFSLTATVTDSRGATWTSNFTFSVFGITTGSLPNVAAFTEYSQAITAVGGSGPYQITASGLPAGMRISGSGQISGSASRQGNFTIAAQAIDAQGFRATKSLTLTVTAPGPLAVPSATLPAGGVGTPYSHALIANGGAPPYTWSLTAGTLPAGLNLLGVGTITGVPTAPGVFSFTATATDSTGGTANGTFSLTVTPQPLTINAPSPLSSGLVSVDYPAQVLTAAGGTPPYRFTVSAGAPAAGPHIERRRQHHRHSDPRRFLLLYGSGC